MVLECKELALDMSTTEVIKCSHEANEVVDSLAKASHSSRSSEVWDSSIPDFISHLIVNDLSIVEK